MSDQDIVPGKTLLKPLLHPVTHKVLLPAGTILTAGYIERIQRQGLESFLLDCLGAVSAAGEGSGARARDLDDFDIDIPALPDIIAEFAAAAVLSPTQADGPYVATAAHPHWLPGDESAAVPYMGDHDNVTPFPAPTPAFAMAASVQASVSPQRYYHNPTHLLPERSLMGAMLCVDNLEATIKSGAVPAYTEIQRVVQEVVDRLGNNLAGLNNGIEVRIVNQPHHRSHPVNVFILSVVIGLAMSYDPHQLLTLGIAALCHDIGKTAIPPEILDKQGPLSAQEVDLLRAHTLMGKRIMDKLPWATPLMAQIVYEHHERNDGSGYPQRLTDRHIHEMSKIVAVAEVYDALMSDTSYRARYAPEAAFNSIKVGDRTGLDAKVIRAFQRFVVPYPLNSFVLLDTEEVGQVIQTNKANVFKPVIKVGGQVIELADQSGRSIVNSFFKAF